MSNDRVKNETACIKFSYSDYGDEDDRKTEIIDS